MFHLLRMIQEYFLISEMRMTSTKLQNHLNPICKWQQINNMQFNENKFELLRYGKNQDMKISTSYLGLKIEQS